MNKEYYPKSKSKLSEKDKEKIKKIARISIIGLIVSTIFIFGISIAILYFTYNAYSDKSNFDYLGNNLFISILDKKTKELQTKATNGDSEAQYELAEKYYDASKMSHKSFKQMTQRDILYSEKAMELYKQSASNLNLNAMRKLAEIYYKGQFKGKEDYYRAFTLYSELADKGDISALKKLGDMYEYGEGCQEDYKKALEMFIKCYEKSTDYNYDDKIRTAHRIGKLYFQGKKGIPKDYDKAFEWFKKAGEDTRYSFATYDLAIMYENGYGTKQDYKKAFELYKPLAFKNYSKANYRLGYLYENGLGTEKNFDNALKCYKDAMDEWLRLANINKNNGDNDEYMDLYDKHLKAKKDYERLKEKIENNCP